MIRKLLIVFASGFILSIVLLSSAWVIGGDDILSKIHIEYDNSKSTDAGPRSTRTLAFDAGKVLTIDAPVNLRFTRGVETRMSIEGPSAAVDRIEWRDGRLSLGSGARWSDGSLDVTITAPQLPGLVLNGASDVELIGLDQPTLAVESRGAVDLDATGRVASLTIASHGAGDLDFENVEARDASVRIAGVGSVDINASGKVDAKISGAGDISLHRKPEQLTSTVNGLGSIDHDY